MPSWEVCIQRSKHASIYSLHFVYSLEWLIPSEPTSWWSWLTGWRMTRRMTSTHTARLSCLLWRFLYFQFSAILLANSSDSMLSRWAIEFILPSSKFCLRKTCAWATPLTKTLTQARSSQSSCGTQMQSGEFFGSFQTSLKSLSDSSCHATWLSSTLAGMAPS